MHRNQLRSKIHCSTAIRPRYRLVFLREIERSFRNNVQLGGRGTAAALQIARAQKNPTSYKKRDISIFSGTRDIW